MFETLGFSYIGLLFLLMLFVPNLIWARKKPEGYSSEAENKVLVFFERTGEALTCCCVLLFSNFNLRAWTSWSWWLVLAFLLMAMYELWWIRYFRSERKLSDFYSGFLIVPLAGATLPVLAFFTLGIYGKSYCLLLATIILGIGHIGVHVQHRKEIDAVA